MIRAHKSAVVVLKVLAVLDGAACKIYGDSTYSKITFAIRKCPSYQHSGPVEKRNK